MKTNRNITYNILRFIILSITATILVVFCLVVMNISNAQTGVIDRDATSKPGSGKAKTTQNVPATKPVFGFKSSVDDMLYTPDYWVKYLKLKAAEENSTTQSDNTASVEQMIGDKTFWLKEINKYIQQEETESLKTILRDI